MELRQCVHPAAAVRAAVAALSAAFLAACGGGAATLHPAHTLPEGRIAAGAGVSANFSFHERRSSNDEVRRAFEGAVAKSAFAPGVAPWLSARAGLGRHTEAGLTYTGRTARADVRHAFEDDEVALSLGVGASAVFLDPSVEPPARPEIPAADRIERRPEELSYGFDVPVIVGWRSAGAVVEAWAGVRGGAERLQGELPLFTTTSEARRSAAVSATRFYGGGLAGAAIGIRPVWVALQLDVAYQTVSASGSFPGTPDEPGRREATLSGLSLAPAGAILGKF